jgi:hypothetical protein
LYGGNHLRFGGGAGAAHHRVFGGGKV